MSAARGPDTGTASVLLVAVPAPLRVPLQYLPPPDLEAGRIAAGVRVQVPLGRGRRTGVVVGHAAAASVPAARLRHVTAVIDEQPLLPPESIELLTWASSYFHHPPGEVFAEALPVTLRSARPASREARRGWALSPAGRALAAGALARSPRQAAVHGMLRANAPGLPREALAAAGGDVHGALRALVAKGLVERVALAPSAADPAAAPQRPAFRPNEAQRAAICAVEAARDRYGAFLLDGVTGSGKTEVYLRLIEQANTRGRQCLLLIPEIGLTPQMTARLRARIPGRSVVLHSGLGARERTAGWLRARDGEADIVIGTRSAVFTPLPRLGLVVVDEEHDVSFKQQDGFRYSARDLAVVRARRAGVPVVLGSATPSLESLNNVAAGRYTRLVLPERAHRLPPPRVTLLDVRAVPFADGISPELEGALARCLAEGEQALLFINRRGYAPVLMCHACGWLAECRHCDAHLVYHRDDNRLRCHHCDALGAVPDVCPACGAAAPKPVGLGTQRVAAALAARFPGARVQRVDRDAVRARGRFDALVADVHEHRVDILVGTQMLAKGHHFPGVTLVAVLDADGALYSADFRAAERMAQLLVQVAGRAGRGERPGRVLVQTHHPEHVLLRTLLAEGYAGFARRLLAERRAARLPPFAWWALLRAEAVRREDAYAFLEQARAAAGQAAAPLPALLGPVAAPMERRAGRHRVQLLVDARERRALHHFLNAWLPMLDALPTVRRVRWSLDVDPQDTL